jgi:chemotaxis signal transduction protein
VSVFVVVRLQERLLALPLPAVHEVFRMVAVAAELPRAPRHCLGVVDWRGRLVPLFDLGARLGLLPVRSPAELIDAHIVLVQDAVGEVAFVVSEVRELVDHEAEQLAAGGSAPLGRLTVGAVRCSDGRLAALVEEGSLLTLRARQQLRAALDALEPARPVEGEPS